MDDPDELRRLLWDWHDDPVAQDSRAALCRILTSTFQEAGHLLWTGGSLIGADRVEGSTPFGFGSDATVGLATVAQIAGELSAGVTSLLESDNSYAACALLRQLVEVEYLAWAFAEDEPEASAWLRSSQDERLRRWQPRHIRARSGGRFRASDYGLHCELGGHPSPDARVLLPCHSVRLPMSWWWLELAIHGVSTWDYLVAAADRTWYAPADQIRAIAEAQDLAASRTSWQESDALAPHVGQEATFHPQHAGCLHGSHEVVGDRAPSPLR